MTKMTKAQLVDENIRLRAQCDTLETQLARQSAQHSVLREQYVALEIQLSDSRMRVNSRVQGRAERPDPRAFSSYWDYVRAEKAAQKGLSIVSYLGKSDFVNARRAA